MSGSQTIEKDGILLGAAVPHEMGCQFIAVDARVADMDQCIWPSMEYARSSVLQFFRAGRIANRRLQQVAAAAALPGCRAARAVGAIDDRAHGGDA